MEEDPKTHPGTTDPLHLLPAEIVLRILDFTSISSLANLLRVNRNWKQFVDENQELIYAESPKTEHPPNAKDFSFLSEARTFNKYFADVSSWKDLCKRQTLLRRNWHAETPITRESTIRIEEDPVWRFRPDFKRRFFLSTSQGGGVFVTCFDTGRKLWSLNEDSVRAFAHLEYQDGTAVWDREGNCLEVWRTDLDGLERGEFRQVATLPHERQTRGFQLSHDTLCVVSSEGEGYVYDLRGPPKLRTRVAIEQHAVGHLDQGPDVVVYSMGKQGYHFYDKTSGQHIGVINPKSCSSVFHIVHPAWESDTQAAAMSGFGGLWPPYPPREPKRDRTNPINLKSGAYPPTGPYPTGCLEDDEWGAGMMDGDLFVGISRCGRTLVCPNWRKALADGTKTDDHISIIECDSDGATFDFGGWLSVSNHRIIFEIQCNIYVVGLTDSNTVCAGNTSRPSFAFSTSLALHMATPVSLMAVYDDCIMTTYTTLRLRSRATVGMTRAVPTKAIRVLSFAPSDDDGTLIEASETTESDEQPHLPGLRPSMAAMMDLDEFDDMGAEFESFTVSIDEEEETELEELD